ncbi:hypothetical protein ON010_g13139 [Phytophthora cinnamomi]|nr:hypothetical protein ON010_g13139 [Phytophthora cinnamomi]
MNGGDMPYKLGDEPSMVYENGWHERRAQRGQREWLSWVRDRESLDPDGGEHGGPHERDLGSERSRRDDGGRNRRLVVAGGEDLGAEGSAARAGPKAAVNDGHPVENWQARRQADSLEN